VSSPEQIDANRRNGGLSNGPTTPEGKAASSKNALKHGLLSREILLPDEDASAFEKFSERLREALNPIGEVEQLLVDRIGSLSWRLRRLGEIEAGVLAWYQQCCHPKKEPMEEIREVAAELQLEIERGNPWALAILSVAERQKREPKEEADLSYYGRAFIRDCKEGNSLSNLSRYESRMERSLFRSLHELQRLQAARQGEPVPAPQVVDIDVTVLPDLRGTGDERD
jgi:hypothetical protein